MSTVITLVVLIALGVWAYKWLRPRLMSGSGKDSLEALAKVKSLSVARIGQIHEPGAVMARDDITSRRVTVASKAELDAAVAEYVAQGFQLKAISDTTASLEKIESGYKPFKAFLLLLLCLIPGIIPCSKTLRPRRSGRSSSSRWKRAPNRAGIGQRRGWNLAPGRPRRAEFEAAASPARLFRLGGGLADPFTPRTVPVPHSDGTELSSLRAHAQHARTCPRSGWGSPGLQRTDAPALGRRGRLGRWVQARD